jgi:ABC-type oligopeptide transport system ATPase subunit
MIQVKNLSKTFYSSQGHPRKAVSCISFEIHKGETLSLIGESGSGKSTTGRLLLGSEEPTEGEVIYQGKNIFAFSDSELFDYRKKVQMIFQDHYSSLNPRMTVEEIIAEPFQIHSLDSPQALKLKIDALMEDVGLSRTLLHRFPHELSGGQRQRIVIARALALKPEFLICDEPLASLDLSVQAQVIQLLKTLQKKFDLTYLFISHDLAIVKYFSTRVAVMYRGEIVETGAVDDVYLNPVHPYTQELLGAKYFKFSP